MDDAANAAFEKLDVESDEQTQRPFESFQVRDDLSDVHSGKLLDGFELDADQTIDDQIGAKTDIESQIVPNEWDRFFLLDRKPAASQFVRQDHLIDRLQQSRPQPPFPEINKSHTEARRHRGRGRDSRP